MRGVLIGFVLLLVFLPVSASATDYYVDATGGDNSNNGTSPETAWRTISKVNGELFLPGDFVLFKRGEVWREKLTVPNSGSSGNPITFGAYGTGDKPKILGSTAANDVGDWTNEAGNLWYTSSATEIRGCVFDSEASSSTVVDDKVDLDTNGEEWWDSVNSRVYLYSDENPATKWGGSIEIQKYDAIIEINEKSYITIDGLDLRYSGKYGVGLAYDTIGDYLTVQNCTLKYIGHLFTGETYWYGCAIRATGVEHFTATDNTISYVYRGILHAFVGACVVDIQNNDISYVIFGMIDGDDFKPTGIQLGGEGVNSYAGSTVKNNTIHHFLHKGISLSHASDIIVEYNTVHTSYNDNRDQNVGIMMGALQENDTIRYNYVYGVLGNPAAGLGGVGIHTRTSTNGLVSYNLIADCNSGIMTGLLADGCNNQEIYNNMIYDCNRYAIMIYNGIDADNMQNVTIHNNICDSDINDIRLRDYVAATGGYNCLVNDAAVALQTGATYTGAANDLYATDPLFTDVGNDDYTLTASSPCIDAGTNVGLTYDYEGNPVPQGLAPDIGAYEYSPQTCSGICKPNTCDSYDNCSPSSGMCVSGYCCSGDCVTSEPVALYHFDEGSGETAADSSGNGNDGTIQGAIWTTGISGNALEFDGVNDYVSVSENDILDPSEITIEAWIRISSTPTINGDVISKGANDGYRFRVNNDRTVKWFETGNTNSIVSARFVPINEWTHITVVGSSSGMRIYINGDLEANNSVPYGGPNTANALEIGAEPQFSEYFNGTIDEVRIYDRALTPEEILDHYNELSGHIRADLNGNGVVDILDLGIVAVDFGKTTGFNDPDADTNSDGLVDIFDVVFVASRFT